MLSVAEFVCFRQIQKQLEDARQANDILSSEHDKTLAELEAAMKVPRCIEYLIECLNTTPVFS